MNKQIDKSKLELELNEKLNKLGNIKVLDILKNDDISKVCKIELNGIELILKIKNTSFTRNQIELINRLISKGVKLTKIIRFEEVENIKYIFAELVEGVTLEKVMIDNKYIGVEQLLKELCKEIYKLHTSEGLDDIGHKKQDNIEYMYSIKENILNNIKYINNIGKTEIIMKSIKMVKNFIGGSEQNIYGVVHGDFHNLSNIIVKNINEEYKINRLIDLDSIKYDIFLTDIGMLYNTTKYFKLEELIIDEYSNYFKDKEKIKRYTYISSIYESLKNIDSEINTEDKSSIISHVKNIEEVLIKL